MSKHKLTDSTIRALKPKTKQYAVVDGGGLYVEVTPGGSKLWRHRFRFNGKETRQALGTYPAVTLQDARSKHAANKKLLAQGVNPVDDRKTSRIAKAVTYATIAAEWLQLQRDNMRAHSTVSKMEGRQRNHVLPHIGAKPIAEVTRLDVSAILDRLVNAGHRDPANRVRMECASIFRYAINKGHMAHNPAADRERTLPKPDRKPFAAIIDRARLGQVLRSFESFRGSPQVRLALCLLPLVMTRPGELAKAEWSEIDLDAAMWTIPAERMKARRVHHVPLSRQALAILREAKAYSRGSRYVFPHRLDTDKHISENTIGKAMQSLGIPSAEATPHGFRKTASTILHEDQHAPELIEAQLAHKYQTAMQATYNLAKHLPRRAELVQVYADLLDTLKAQTS